MSDRCPNCGGTLIGDGYTAVIHCENATDVDAIAEAEADAGPIYCETYEGRWVRVMMEPIPVLGWQCTCTWVNVPDAKATRCLLCKRPVPPVSYFDSKKQDGKTP